MATDIPFKITVDTDIADLSIGELKQAFKDLTKEIGTTQVGTEKYKQTLTKLGDVKGALKDVKEQINALDPEKKFRAIAQVGSSIASGFAAAQGAVALFGSESEDLQKVLVRVQAATALASGLQGLAGFGKALQTAGLAMKAFALSNPFTAIAVAVAALVVGLIALTEAMQDANRESTKLQKTYDDLVKSSNIRIEQLENELIAIGNVTGKEEEALKIKKKIIEENIKQAEASILVADAKRREAIEEENWLTIVEKIFSPAFAIARRVQRVKDADEEVALQKQKLDRLKAQLIAANTDITNLQTKVIEKENELLDKLKPSNELGDPNDDPIVIVNKARGEAIEAAVEDQTYFANSTEEFWKRIKSGEFDVSEYQKQKAREVRDVKIKMAYDSLTVIHDFMELFYANTEKEARRAFEINKAVSIAQAVISTYQGANAIFASAAANPSTVLFPAQPFITAGIAIASGLANVAKIARTKFQGNADTGGGGGGASGNSVSAPNLQSPQSQQPNVTISQRGVNEDQQGNFAGFQQPIKAYVLENEISEKQKGIKSIEERTTF